jgi:hypothetical protein
MQIASVFFLLLFFLSGASIAALSVEVGENTGLRTWLWTHEGISLRLVQRLPDQTRAYLQGRGFQPDVADEMATSCFFGSMFRNDGTLPLDFDLTTWRVVQKGRLSSMRVREFWRQKLEKSDAPKAAKIALNWSLMPTRQHFEPGDYNWGMTVYGRPPGEYFDLHLQIVLQGKIFKAVLPDLQCAPETIN